ncbi:MAG: helix-turn-helix transcriptional regulator [Acidobacteria bacterium]|nr:helix-turn-helix transcriptional regulator [Acidobacteriota bacterium]MBV9478379.1 helix-turn-helix transcriptional regulator [Acidobacteriota bacterium]
MVAINPGAADLGRINAVLHGRNAHRYEHRFTGPLSVKAVMRGVATWETRAGRYEVGPGTVLLLEDGEEYEITIDSLQPVETWCFFFARGFVEDAWRAATTSSSALLDAPEDIARAPLAERLHFDAPLVAAMQRAHAMPDSLDAAFFATANAIVGVQCDVAARAERLPSLRASTREELARRLRIATAFLHANVGRRVTIDEAAREACLSPFHFHRLFASFHGTTPYRYLTTLRMQRARMLLRATDRPIADVAFDCGFESLGSFTTLFTRVAGVPPARFRRNRETDARIGAIASSA